MSAKTVEVDGFMETPHNAAILTLQKSIGDFRNIHDLIADLWTLVKEYDMDDIAQIRDILILEEMKGPVADEPQTLAALYLYARALYGDPSVRFDVLHKEVTERFMKLMKTDVPLCPKLTALYDGAKASYDDPTIAFDQLHTFVCQNFVDIMSQEAEN